MANIINIYNLGQAFGRSGNVITHFHTFAVAVNINPPIQSNPGSLWETYWIEDLFRPVHRLSF